MKNEFKVISVQDLLKNYNPRPRERIGCCRFDKKINSIIIEVNQPNRHEYDIDLDRCKTAGACLDWIHQIHDKSWRKPIMDDFLSMLFERIDGKLWSGIG